MAIAIPVKAAAVNLLSMGAAAIMVRVFGSFVFGDPLRILGADSPGGTARAWLSRRR